jgi:hypothetical protein
MVLNIDGGDRVTYTYNKIDDSTGEPISRNNKGNFYVVDDELKVHIDAIRNFVKDNKLND